MNSEINNTMDNTAKSTELLADILDLSNDQLEEAKELIDEILNNDLSNLLDPLAQPVEASAPPSDNLIPKVQAVEALAAPPSDNLIPKAQAVEAPAAPSISYPLAEVSRSFTSSKWSTQTREDGAIVSKVTSWIIDNPYYIGLFNTPIESKEIDIKEEKKKQTYQDIFANYNDVYILCRQNGIKFDEILPIMEKTLTIESMTNNRSIAFNNFSNKLVLVKVSNKIMKITDHYKSSRKVIKEDLEYFNKNKYTFRENEIVVMMPDIEEKNVNKYITLFNPMVKIPDLVDIIILINYCIKSNNYYVINRLCKLLMLTDESEYWTSKSHIIPDFNEELEKRSFRKLENSALPKEKPEVVNKNVDYLNFKMNKNAKPPTIQIDKSLKVKYYIENNNNELTKEMLNKIFTGLTSNKLKYYLFNILLISKRYCHLVINNSEILTIMKYIIEQNLILYRYLFGYAWFCFYLEENICKTRATTSSRYVYDLETACKLPNFQFLDSRPNFSPYLPLFYKTPFDIKTTKKRYCELFEINNLDTFKAKLKIFTAGLTNIDIFEGFNWSTYAISGSVMPACLCNNEKLYKSTYEEFEDNYKDSDLDLMCNKECIFSYLDSVSEITQLIKTNLKNKFEEDKIKFDYTYKKTSSLVVHSEYFKEKLNEINVFTGKVWTVEKLEESLEDPLIREYLYLKYYALKFERIKEDRKKYNKPEYEIYHKLSSPDDMRYYLYNKENKYEFSAEDIVFYMSDLKKDIIPKEKNYPLLKINETIKVQIKCNQLPRSIELFRCRKNADFFSMVSRFHLPCVRSFYNGKTVYLMPSAISAYLTRYNLDYKIFLTMKDPCDILLKYNKRGFNIPLSQNEHNTLKKYIEESPKWSNLKLGNDNDTNDESILDINDLENDYIYRINKNHELIIKASDNKDELKTNIQKLKHEFVEKHCINPFSLQTINSNGSSVPLKKWVIDALSIYD